MSSSRFTIQFQPSGIPSVQARLPGPVTVRDQLQQELGGRFDRYVNPQGTSESTPSVTRECPQWRRSMMPSQWENEAAREGFLASAEPACRAVAMAIPVKPPPIVRVRSTERAETPDLPNTEQEEIENRTFWRKVILVMFGIAILGVTVATYRRKRLQSRSRSRS